MAFLRWHILLILFLIFWSATAQRNELLRFDSLTRIHTEDSSSYVINQRYLSLAREKGSVYHQAQALTNLAVAYLISDDYDRALELNLSAFELAKKSNDSSLLAKVNRTFGWLYYDVGEAKQAESYHKQTLEYLLGTTDSLEICTSLNAVGLTLALGGRYAEALVYFKKALSLGYSIKNEERILAAMNNIGDAEFRLNNLSEALVWLERSQPLAQRHPDVLRGAEVLNSKANVMIALGRFREADAALIESNKLIARSHSNSRKEFQMQNAYLSAELYKRTGNFTRAYHALELHNFLRDQILSDDKKRSLAERKIFWQSRMREEEIEKMKKEHEQRIQQRNAVAVGVVLLAAIAFFVYSRERKLRHREHQLAETREAFNRAELAKSGLEKEALSSKLEFKNRELTNYALHISQRNDLQRAFLDELEQLKNNASPQLVTHLNQVVKRFSGQEEISKDAEAFHIQVERENEDFFYNLSQRFPELTERERRLCAQVRLNLSIKDIASLNDISIKSVEMARYRLRKKLQLDHDDSLTEFIKSI